MQIQVMLFGQLKDVTGVSDILLDDISDTDTLINVLHARYPALADFKYAMAVDKKVIHNNTVLSGNNTIALLPPFSGG
jgi:molybdopterin synthase sulfur carrier subunit